MRCLARSRPAEAAARLNLGSARRADPCYPASPLRVPPFLPPLSPCSRFFDSLLRYAPVAHPGLHICLSTLDMRYRAGVRARSFDSQISQSAPPAELPLAVYLDLPKVSVRPSGQPSVALSRFSLKLDCG